VANVLNDEYQMPDILRQRLKMDVESFNRTAEKLVSQGAAAFDIAGNIRSTGQTNWRASYDTQLAFRHSQIDRIVAFAESPQCRMSALVQHFGDTADGLRPCGHCDFCSPERATAQTYRPPTSQEDRQLRAILRSLDGGAAKATGKLHTDLALGIDRKQFDSYLDALTRAGLITLTADTFTNAEGTLINFKRASLTHEGKTRDEADDLNLLLKDSSDQKPSKSRAATAGKTRLSKVDKADAVAAYTPAQKDLDQRLREWRKGEAAKTGKPAFIVFSDAILTAIAQSCPTTISSLLNISGIGPEKADRYGAAIVAICTSTPIPLEYGAPDKPKPVRATQSRPKASAPITTGSKNISREQAAETFQRPRAISSEPAEALTGDQQALDQRLRDWRKAEAEKLGLPQFFVLGSSALRSIVLQRPQTIAQLKTISGIGSEKSERFGSAILEACKG
jgi:ATP-dependent DNA helicase RecQ